VRVRASTSDVSSATVMEEHARDTVEKRQGDEDDNRRERRAEQGGENFADRHPHRFDPAQAGGEFGVDGFDDNDRVVDHQSDRGGDSAECHQVETQAEQLHRQDREEHRDGNDGRGDERAAPVLEKQIENGCRKNQAERDRFPDPLQRRPYQQRLIVEGAQRHVGGKLLLHAGKLLLHLVGDLDRARIRL
jgi:hypothetical protein